MANTKTPLEEDKMFHIYNHAVGVENFFNSSENYTFFLLKLKKYLQNYIDIYAYCLMPNHFHFVIKIKSKEDIINELNRPTRLPNRPTRFLKPRRSDNSETDFVPKIISSQFSHFFNSYAKAYNKKKIE